MTNARSGDATLELSLTDRFRKSPSWAFFLVVVIPVFLVFFATSSRWLPYHIDPFSNTVPAWNMATEGSVYLDDFADVAGPEYWSVGWFVAVDDTAVSMYPPGAALWAVPFYVVGPSDAEVIVGQAPQNPGLGTIPITLPPMSTAAFAASLATSLAIGFLGLTFRRMVMAEVALVGAYLAAFGTSAWSIASDQLWQHGPAMMWLALAGLLAGATHLWSSGLSYGLAALTRPPTAVMAAATGLAMGIQNRSWRPVLRIGLGSLLGIVAVVAYNTLVFGEPSISGGYGDGFSDRALSSSPLWWAGNFLRALLDPRRGLFVWSPFLLVLLPGIRQAWRVAPAWVRGSAIGGILYLALQYKVNRYSGGNGFYGYRYPLEALVVFAPLLMIAYREWVAVRPRAVRVFAVLAVISVTLQAVVALR